MGSLRPSPPCCSTRARSRRAGWRPGAFGERTTGLSAEARERQSGEREVSSPVDCDHSKELRVAGAREPRESVRQASQEAGIGLSRAHLSQCRSTSAQSRQTERRAAFSRALSAVAREREAGELRGEQPSAELSVPQRWGAGRASRESGSLQPSPQCRSTRARRAGKPGGRPACGRCSTVLQHVSAKQR